MVGIETWRKEEHEEKGRQHPTLWRTFNSRNVDAKGLIDPLSSTNSMDKRRLRWIHAVCTQSKSGSASTVSHITHTHKQHAGSSSGVLNSLLHLLRFSSLVAIARICECIPKRSKTIDRTWQGVVVVVTGSDGVYCVENYLTTTCSAQVQGRVDVAPKRRTQSQRMNRVKPRHFALLSAPTM